MGEVLEKEKLRQVHLIRFHDAHWEKHIPLQDDQIHNMVNLSNCYGINFMGIDFIHWENKQ